MRIPGQNRRRPCVRRAACRDGFTMVEIAIALGVIAFALIAIIGILPTGLQVQRDNRSETIVNQDATVWVDAIKSGARGMDELVNFVDRIDVRLNPGLPTERTDTYTGFKYGWEIIGLLTTPARTNAEVFASVWAISGSAAEKEPDPNDRSVAFKYRLHVNIEPGPQNSVSFYDATVPKDPSLPPDYPLTSLYDLRLSMRYSLVGDTGVGELRSVTPPRGQTVRTSISKRVVTETVGNITYTFFAQ